MACLGGRRTGYVAVQLYHLPRLSRQLPDLARRHGSARNDRLFEIASALSASCGRTGYAYVHGSWASSSRADTPSGNPSHYRSARTSGDRARGRVYPA